MCERDTRLTVSARLFKKIRDQVCQWWTVTSRIKPSNNVELTWEQWQELRFAVNLQAEFLQGRSLDEAVAIVSIQCPCNRVTLAGLNADARIWEHK